MYEQLIKYLSHKPALYAPSTAPFWDDEHISKGMLDAHLNTNIDAASRKPATLDASAEWIARLCLRNGANKLLDLGCGPGLYAERFTHAGFRVTGVDLSRRSIDYARDSAKRQGLSIDYRLQDYLSIDFEDEFDVVTLIYCDFGVLSPNDRATLLKKIARALKKGGAFIVDAHTEGELADFKEGIEICSEEAGFWSAEKHVVIQRSYRYRETGNFLEQDVVITKDDIQCYNIWNQIYTADSLLSELATAGLRGQCYDDVTGKPYTGEAVTVCAVATK